jgi:hypothetical protein
MAQRPTTLSKLLGEAEKHLDKAKPEELAELRQNLRKEFGLPEKPEPVLEQQEEESDQEPNESEE